LGFVDRNHFLEVRGKMRRYFGFAFIVWFVSSFPRFSKTVVILAALAALLGMWVSAVKP
jgi:uncharacterized membrane protein